MSYLLVLALEVGVIYLAGSYALSRLAALNVGGALGSLGFYLLVFPGVVLHESAHYLACKLTFTRVARFAPFSPERDSGGRILLGSVSHAKTNPVTGSVIGLAPLVVNPLAIVVLTHYLAPFEALSPPPSTLWSFLKASPEMFALWAYLLFSFALGSSLSREDLSALPAAAALGAAVVAVVWKFDLFAPASGGSGAGLAGSGGALSAVEAVAAPASALYVFPALATVVAAVVAYTVAGLQTPTRQGEG